MNLFIDTSNNYIIFALIEAKKVVSFVKKETNKDATKNVIKILDDFLRQNYSDIRAIDEYYLVVGPGSFTSTKIGLNIIKSINLVYPVRTVKIISSFNLLKEKKRRYVVIPFGKEKYYYKDFNVFFTKFKKNIIVKNQIRLEKKTVFGYVWFHEKKLEVKLSKFKKVDLDKINLIYIDNFNRRITYEN